MKTTINTQERTKFNLGIYDSGDFPYDVIAYPIPDSPMVVRELQFELQKPLQPEGLDLETQELERIEGALRVLVSADIIYFMRTVFDQEPQQTASINQFKTDVFRGGVDRRTKNLGATSSLYEAFESSGLLDPESVSRIESFQDSCPSSQEGESTHVDAVRLSRIKIETILDALNTWHTNNRFR